MPDSRRETLTLAQALQRALALVQNQEFSKAEELYQKILTVSPNHFGALHKLGSIKVKQGKDEQGIALIRAALRINPNSPDALNNLGVALGNINRIDDALASFQKALAFKANFAEVLYNQGKALSVLK